MVSSSQLVLFLYLESYWFFSISSGECFHFFVGSEITGGSCVSALYWWWGVLRVSILRICRQVSRPWLGFYYYYYYHLEKVAWFLRQVGCSTRSMWTLSCASLLTIRLSLTSGWMILRVVANYCEALKKFSLWRDVLGPTLIFRV